MNLTLLTTAIAAAVAGAAGFGLAWQLQAGNISEINLERANERISIQRAARATIERTTGAVIAAQNAAASRAVVLRRDADAARTAADGLRDDLTAIGSAAASSIDARNRHAATVSELLVESASLNRELAQACDGHASDVRTLMEAWPK
jgi:hypothetical protein